MATEIRSLLAAAQSAEVKGEMTEAARLLREAAAFYRDHQSVTRAMQMLRHARRLEGAEDPGPPLDGFAPREMMGEDDAFDGPAGHVDWSNEETGDEVFGFGDESGDAEPDPAIAERAREPFERVLALAGPALNAWCSFCCRPSAETGDLVEGPANAYLCANCAGTTLGLLSDGSSVKAGAAPSPKAAHGDKADPGFWLPSQRATLEQIRLRKPLLSLIIGVEGAGKTEVLRALARSVSVLDAGEEPVGDGVKATVIAVRGALPAPSLVLQGEHGSEPIYDTDALLQVTGGKLPGALLSKVDAVFELTAPDAAALTALAIGLLGRRGITLPDTTLAQVVSLALKSGRSAHELVALVARIPAGRYQTAP